MTWLLLPVVKHSAPGRNLASTRLTLLKGQCNWNRIIITGRMTPVMKGRVRHKILVTRRIKAVKGKCGTDTHHQENYTFKGTVYWHKTIITKRIKLLLGRSGTWYLPPEELHFKGFNVLQDVMHQENHNFKGTV